VKLGILQIFELPNCKQPNAENEHDKVYFEIHGVFTPLIFTPAKAAFLSSPKHGLQNQLPLQE
jgi:hypothetical protein